MLPLPALRLSLGLAACCLLTACPVHWLAQSEGTAAGDRQRQLVARHHAQLDQVAKALNDAHVTIPLLETRLMNAIGFEEEHQVDMLAIYVNGKEVKGDQTHFQRAAASFGGDAETVLHVLDTAGLLDAGEDYKTLKLGDFYRVRDSVMSSEIGSEITAEPEVVTFYLKLPLAKAFCEHQLSFKELINQSLIVGSDGNTLTGHMY